MPVNDLYQVTFIQTCNSTRFTNVIAFRQQSADGPGVTEAELAAAFLGDILTPWADCLSDQWDANCLEISKVGVTGMAPWRSAPIATSGSVLTPALPTSQVMNLTMIGIEDDVARRGHIYLSGMPAANEEDNNLDSTQLLLIAQLRAALIIDIDDGASGATFRAGVLNAAHTNFKPYTTGEVRIPLAKLSQRRGDVTC